MFQGSLQSFQNLHYFWRETTAQLGRQKKSQTRNSVIFVNLLGISSFVVHGWLGHSTAQLCKGLSKREQDFYKSTLWLSSHRIYRLGFQQGSALSSCLWGINLTGSYWVWSISKNSFRNLNGEQVVLKNLVIVGIIYEILSVDLQCK